MSEYQAGKEVALLEQELRRTQALLEQVYAIIEHNLKAKKLSEPPEEKKK